VSTIVKQIAAALVGLVLIADATDAVELLLRAASVVVVERDDSAEETRRRAVGNLLDDSLRKGSARRVITLEDFTMTAMPAVGAHVAIGAIGVFFCGALPLLYPIFSRRRYLLLCCFRR